MDIGEIAENTSRGKTSNALITIILAGFLWVGKTTFEHVGQISGLQHELSGTHQDNDSLRAQYDQIVGMLNERTKSRFTREDADKLVQKIDEVQAKQDTLKDGFLRDYASLKIEIAAIDSKSNATSASSGITQPPRDMIVAAQHIQQLEGEIATLQAELVRLQHHVGMSRGTAPAETPRALLAPPNLDRVSITKR